MNGLTPIRTVEDLISHLSHCPPNAEVMLMPDDGDPYPIGGVLAFSSEVPPQVWILIDEFGETERQIDWSVGPSEDDETEQGVENTVAVPVTVEPVDEDVVKVRGKLRSA